MAPDDSPLFSIRGSHYYIQPGPRATLSPSLVRGCQKPGSQFVLVTVIKWNESSFTDRDLELKCQEFSAKDDVWCRSFLSAVVLLQAPGLSQPSHAKSILSIDRTKHNLTDGPHAICKLTGQVFRVYKLYIDTHHAFLSGVVQTEKAKTEFSELLVRTVTDDSTKALRIPVPSRLYSKSGPLAGLRFALKDTIALKGLKTGYGSRAYLETYPAEAKTAHAIQVLLDAGAVIVGKVKTTEFAEGVDPLEWIDSVCPYNPRGDGAQKPSSSSTGSATAVAAYEWLDFAVGTDTGGSIRHPAGVNGVFGNRPTQGAIDLAGVLGATNLFNTVGIFARDVSVFNSVGSQLLGSICKPQFEAPSQKYNLIYLTRGPQAGHPPHHRGGQHRWFPHPSDDVSTLTEADKVTEVFIQDLERQLRCKRIPLNIYALWEATPPIGLPRSLDEAVGGVYSAITTYSAVHTVIDQFIADYAALHNGDKPSFSTLVQRRLDFGRSISTDTVANALDAMQSFTQWMEGFLFGAYGDDSTTILVFPQSCGEPEYRDEIPDRTILFNDMFSIYAFGYLVGCPDYTIPIAEVPHHSRVTNKPEHFPVSVSLVGRPGGDKELFELLGFLHETGTLRDVKAGSRLYSEDSSDDTAETWYETSERRRAALEGDAYQEVGSRVQ